MPPDCHAGHAEAERGGAVSPGSVRKPSRPLPAWRPLVSPEPSWSVPAPVAPWARRLEVELADISRTADADFGVFVRDLDTGQRAAYRADEAWYLASTVKVPVAIAVLRAVERGDFTLDTPLTLRAADVVDGAGETNRHRVGAPLRVRYLLEQMIVHSDNTASDMLIGLVGIQAVNGVVQALVPNGVGPVTSLADVRRQIYAQLTPAAAALSGADFLLLRSQPTDCARVSALAGLLKVPAGSLAPLRLGAAYAAYYATGVNTGRLDAYAELLQALAEGRLLDAPHTAFLLAVMERTQTGKQRISAGLPPEVRFAHKTGTQRARTCDAGVVTVPRLDAAAQRVVVAVCTRGEMSTARAERLLRRVGAAICHSGLITEGIPHAPSCPVLPRTVYGPGAAGR